MKVPQKYLSKNPDVMKREIKKHAEKKDSDSSAYKEWISWMDYFSLVFRKTSLLMPTFIS